MSFLSNFRVITAELERSSDWLLGLQPLGRVHCVADVLADIGHRVEDAPYRHTALGVIRVRNGEIVHYDDYMDPIAVARLLGRTEELAAALAGT